MSRPTTPLMMTRNRNNSTVSLSASSMIAPSSCPHRGHMQLEKLKTLKLSDNKLSRLVLSIVDRDDLESSTESLVSHPEVRLVTE